MKKTQISPNWGFTDYSTENTENVNVLAQKTKTKKINSLNNCLKISLDLQTNQGLVEGWIFWHLGNFQRKQLINEWIFLQIKV